jgi:hypothetical protein
MTGQGAANWQVSPSCRSPPHPCARPAKAFATHKGYSTHSNHIFHNLFHFFRKIHLKCVESTLSTPAFSNEATMKKMIPLFCLLIPAISFAQPYSIDWHKVSGGGGTSSGGQYSVSGTIGQHDSGGPMSGGNFSLTGGFWALYAVQTPGAPSLTIQWINPTTVKVSWASPSTGFVLQQNNNLANANSWANFGGMVNDNGTIKSVIISPPSGTLYFRLKH